MPRKTLKKFLPDPHWIKNHPNLNWLGEHIKNPNLWHLSHRSVSVAAFVGIFCAFLPMPFQMVVAAVIAVIVGCNLPVSVALVWISNPVTMPAILYFCYRVGLWILGIEASHNLVSWHLDTLYENSKAIWKPLILGCLICGVSAGSVGYITLRLAWLISVRRSWSKRSKLRKRRDQKSD